MTTRRPSCSTTYMLRPISPVPPKAMTRTGLATGKRAALLQHALQNVALHRACGYQWQPHPVRGNQTKHFERRLNEDRIRGHEQRSIKILEAGIDLPSAVQIARRTGGDDLSHLLARQMRRDRDDPCP